MPNPCEVPGIGELRYDWAAVGRLRDEFGPNFDAVISQCAIDTDLDTLAKAVAIGSKIASVDDVLTASPPVTATISAVIAALNMAFHGTTEAPQDADENPPMAEVATSSVTPDETHTDTG